MYARIELCSACELKRSIFSDLHRRFEKRDADRAKLYLKSICCLGLSALVTNKVRRAKIDARIELCSACKSKQSRRDHRMDQKVI